jgi:hypothetical protein
VLYHTAWSAVSKYQGRGHGSDPVQIHWNTPILTDKEADVRDLRSQFLLPNPLTSVLVPCQAGEPVRGGRETADANLLDLCCQCL